MVKSKAFLAVFLFSLTNFGGSTARASDLLNAASSDSSLPIEKIGVDDLLTVSVADCPDLTKSFRVSKDGRLTLPLLSQSFKAAGLTAPAVAAVIATQLIEQNILVKPVVSVQVSEYRSRFVTVAGAVKHPGRLQISGHMTVLDALAASEGVLPDAGPSLVLTSPLSEGKSDAAGRTISLKKLMEKSDPEINTVLSGGEEIRVPAAEKVYVTGNVKRPGAYAVRDDENSSVLKILAECEGALPFSGSVAYIYRAAENGQGRTEIPVQLSKLLARKSADVPLFGTDILYIPDHKGKRMTAQVLDRVIQFSAYSSSQALILGH